MFLMKWSSRSDEYRCYATTKVWEKKWCTAWIATLCLVFFMVVSGRGCFPCVYSIQYLLCGITLAFLPGSLRWNTASKAVTYSTQSTQDCRFPLKNNLSQLGIKKSLSGGPQKSIGNIMYENKKINLIIEKSANFFLRKKFEII